MATLVKKENITIQIGEYEKAGQKRKEWRTIGELITMRGDDGSEYQFGRFWGPTGAQDFKVFAQQSNDQQAQQGMQQAQQAAGSQNYNNNGPSF